MLRKLILSLLLLGVGFGAGAFSYRWYANTYIIRQAPDELEARPVVAGPSMASLELIDVGLSITELQPDAIDLAPHPADFLVWEAEWANALTGSFEVLRGPDTSGGTALWAREGMGRDVAGPSTTTESRETRAKIGSARWTVEIKSAGRYRLFMRIWAMDKCGNSCWVGMDAENRGELHYFPGGRDGRYGSANHYWPDEMLKRWLWVDDEGSSYDLRPGRHTLRVDVREDGFAIDQIALVPLGASTVPEGFEPNSILPSAPGTSEAMSLALGAYILTTGTDLSTAGHYWLRSNAAEATKVEIAFRSAGAAVLPDDHFSAILTPERPILQIPLQLRVPTGSPRRAYAVSAAVQSDTDTKDSGRVRFARPLDWWVLGPLDYSEARAMRGKMREDPTIDVTQVPLPAYPHRTWTRVQSEAHYDAFGAIDLGEIFGPQDMKSAYLVTKIRVLKSGVYRIVAAGDDTVDISIGGTTVFRDYSRAPLADTKQSQSISLEEGTHLVLARSYQSHRWWQVFLEFQDQDGEPTASVVGLSMTD